MSDQETDHGTDDVMPRAISLIHGYGTSNGSRAFFADDLPREQLNKLTRIVQVQLNLWKCIVTVSSEREQHVSIQVIPQLSRQDYIDEMRQYLETILQPRYLHGGTVRSTYVLRHDGGNYGTIVRVSLHGYQTPLYGKPTLSAVVVQQFEAHADIQHARIDTEPDGGSVLVMSLRRPLGYDLGRLRDPCEAIQVKLEDVNVSTEHPVTVADPRDYDLLDHFRNLPGAVYRLATAPVY